MSVKEFHTGWAESGPVGEALESLEPTLTTIPIVGIVGVTWFVGEGRLVADATLDTGYWLRFEGKEASKLALSMGIDPAGIGLDLEIGPDPITIEEALADAA